MKVAGEEKQVVAMPTEEAGLGRMECGKERGHWVFIRACGIRDAWRRPRRDAHNATGDRRPELLIWLFPIGAGWLTDIGLDVPKDGVARKIRHKFLKMATLKGTVKGEDKPVLGEHDT